MDTEYAVIWGELKETKEVIWWGYYPYETFDFTKTPLHHLHDNHDVEIFIKHQWRVKSFFWWDSNKYWWTLCNWDCQLPKSIQMALLIGAI